MKPLKPDLLRGWLLASAACVAMLAGCASPSATPEEPGAQPTASPWLALAPSALGCAAAAQQRLTVQPPGQQGRELDALLEVDASTMRLAILNLGQMVGTLEWDGQQINPQLSRWWPAVLKPEQVLGDVQLAFWPQQAIVRALPAGWSLQVSGGERVLRYDGVERVKVRQLDVNALEVVYPQGRWSLRIDSPGGADLCSNAVKQG
ncbi:DUF3261 domain-containing protein [Diaphorobacter aerolatus]|uniref:DUF3261 domain-containing protein n=1 Tax=Diaphorobacter aerolatus TaxID=1288495 RepID=A0A7H0GM08_9BURK|nr:DUF3261 domain-containing protein [Diaphorobacter aerolatus]QNP49324.1 DUF3261 domain-containing protein [Diaphorobacter aerolatus]